MEPKEIIDAAKYVTDTLPSIPKVVNNFIDLTIGNWLEYRNTLSKEKFKAKLKEKISRIPKEHRIEEPKLSILGPALEATKYYIEEEEIQELFTNLITSSMDTTYNGIIQHSFVEIIKQLSPYDAKLFASFKEIEPFVSLEQSDDVGGSYTIIDKLYINNYFQDYKQNEISIENLSRLGLISIISDSYITNDSFYNIYSKFAPVYNTFDFPKNLKFCSKKMFKITSFGKAFKEVCIK